MLYRASRNSLRLLGQLDRQSYGRPKWVVRGHVLLLPHRLHIRVFPGHQVGLGRRQGDGVLATPHVMHSHGWQEMVQDGAKRGLLHPSREQGEMNWAPSGRMASIGVLAEGRFEPSPHRTWDGECRWSEASFDGCG